MKWLSCLLIAFSVFVSNVYAEDLKQQEYMIDKIEKLLREQPDHWHITNDTLFYCEDKKYLKDAIEISFPESTPYTDIVVDFRIMKGEEDSYIDFEKPDLGLLVDRDYENQQKLFRRLDKIIKVLLYKQLKDEVGWYVDNMEKKSEETKPAESSEPIEIKEERTDGLKAL